MNRWRRFFAHKNWSQGGFTIIELLIATLIFTVILIVITVGVLQFSRQYYRGVIASRTQNVARQLMDNIVQTIQFSPGTVYELHHRSLSDAAYADAVGYCVGSSVRYSFQLGGEVTSVSPDAAQHQSYHGLVSDVTSGCSTATAALNVSSRTVLTDPDPNITSPATAPKNARELLGEHMRLAKFSITPLGGAMDGAYSINIRIIYGDDDQLTSPYAPDAKCLTQAGDSFCSVADLTTTVKKRVN